MVKCCWLSKGKSQMSHLILVAVAVVFNDGEEGEELVVDFLGLVGPCGDLDEVVVVVEQGTVDEDEGDCTDSVIFPGDGS